MHGKAIGNNFKCLMYFILHLVFIEVCTTSNVFSTLTEILVFSFCHVQQVNLPDLLIQLFFNYA